MLEYIAFNDGFINTRIKAQEMLDGECEVLAAVPQAEVAQGAPTLTTERDAFENWWNAKLAAGEESIDIAFRMFVELTADSAQPQAAESKGLTPEWIWGELMDYCKERGVAPALNDRLFKIVERARSLLIAKGERHAKQS